MKAEIQSTDRRPDNVSDVYVLVGSNPLIVAANAEKAHRLGELMGFPVEAIGVRGDDQMSDMIDVYADDGGPEDDRDEATRLIEAQSVRARRYDSARVHVFLEGGLSFVFDVQDWDDGETPLSDEAANAMAADLIGIGPGANAGASALLYGTFNAGKSPTAPGAYVAMTIKPERVIAFYVEPTGLWR